MAEEGSSPAEEPEEPGEPVAEPATQSQERAEPQEDTDALLSQAKGFGSECPGLAWPAWVRPGDVPRMASCGELRARERLK